MPEKRATALELDALPVPAVVATVTRPDDLASLRGSPSGQAPTVCDLVEIRLDELSATTPAATADAERWIAGLPLPFVATARHPQEGGQGNLDAATRRTLLLSCVGKATCLDIELRSLSDPAFAEIIPESQNAGTAVILSAHDFQGTPPLAELEDLVGRATSAGADVVKLAVQLKDFTVLDEMRSLFETFADTRLSLMGMGPLGKLSRLVLAAAGSVLNYGYLHHANAPGQWPASKLRELYAELGLRPDLLS